MKTLAPTVIVSPEVARAEELTAAIVADLGTVTQSFWRIGRGLHELLDQRLYQHLGYATFRAYCEARLSCEIGQAYKTVRVVRSFFQEDAEKIGLERAAALITYAKLLKTDPGNLVRENILVGDKPLVTASKRDILAAAARERDRLARLRARAPAPRQINRENKRIAALLRGAIKQAGLPRPARVEVDLHSDEVVIRLPRKALVERLR